MEEKNFVRVEGIPEKERERQKEKQTEKVGDKTERDRQIDR